MRNQHFSEAAFGSQSRYCSVPRLQPDHTVQQDTSCLLCRREGRNTLLKKVLLITQQQISMSVLILICAWERSKKFAFILRSWLALNLSKTPIVVNGEKQDPQGNDREWPILDTNHKGDRHVWDRWDMGDTDETDTSHGMKWITLWKHLLPSTDCKGSRGWLAYT